MVLLSEVLDAAQQAHGSQAGVGRAVTRTRATANAWYSGRSIPDYEACLQLAAITGYSAEDVLRAAGHDPSLVSASVQPRVQPELHARLARLGTTLNHVPRSIWLPLLTAIEALAAAGEALQAPTNSAEPTENNQSLTQLSGHQNRRRRRITQPYAWVRAFIQRGFPTLASATAQS